MNKIVTKNKAFRLIGAGCSHTQGCAYGLLGDNIEWINDTVAKQMGVPCSQRYITDNLTWMAGLKRHINIGKIYNFGFGGAGTTSVLRALKNFIVKVNDFSDLIVIVQIANPIRDEMHFRVNSNRDWDVINVKELVHNRDRLLGSDFNMEEFGRTFLLNQLNLPFRALDYLYELYYLQNIFEKLGAHFRVFYGPFGGLEATLDDLRQYEKAYYKRYSSLGYERDIQGIISPSEMLQKLNIINVELIKSKPHTLQSEGLVKNDTHLSKRGNELLADAIFKGLNDKYEFQVQ